MNISATGILFVGAALGSGLVLLIGRVTARSRPNSAMGDNAEATADAGLAGRSVYIGKQELELVFDTIPEEICILDKELRVVRANKSFAEATGQPVQDIIGQKCFSLFGFKEQCGRTCPVITTCRESTPVQRQPMTFVRDGGICHYEISAYPVCDEGGDVLHVIEIRKNVTDEKRVFEYLVRSEKFASIGNMTAGIAHEMSNPLSGIAGNASNLLSMPQKYGLNEKGISRLTSILNLATRATAIMTDLLHLSRRPEQLCILTDINELVKKTVNSLHVWGGQDTERVFTLESSLPDCKCDPEKVQQVIVHLTTNAVHAIKVRKEKKLGSARGRIEFATKKSDGVITISVTDNGCGISDEYRSKVFDPFFSTRPTGEGTGLGLSVANKLIEEQGGRLFFESEEEFTVFSIELPLQENISSQQ